MKLIHSLMPKIYEKNRFNFFSIESILKVMERISHRIRWKTFPIPPLNACADFRWKFSEGRVTKVSSQKQKSTAHN